MDDEAQRLEVLVKAARLVASEPALQGWPVVWKLRAAVQGLDIARGAQGGPMDLDDADLS